LEAGVSRTLPVAGLLTANLDATSYADTSLAACGRSLHSDAVGE
jgi:hypothetical protein